MSSKICLDLMEKKKIHEFIKLFVLFNNHCVHEVQSERMRKNESELSDIVKHTIKTILPSLRTSS